MQHVYCGSLAADQDRLAGWMAQLAEAGLASAALSVVPNAPVALLSARGIDTFASELAGEPVYSALHGDPYPLHGRAPSARMSAAALCSAVVTEGPAALRRIGGSFAFAIIRPRRREVFMAVDRFCIENLYYAETSQGIAFANRAKLLSSHPDIARRFSAQAIYDYLYFHCLPGPATGFRGMQRLLPGHFLRWRDGTVELAPYWEPHYREADNATPEALAAELRALLEAAVARRMTGSDPVGCFLSGGLDSSTITGLCAKLSPGRVTAFTIGFDAPEYDEMDFASAVAGHFKVPHQTYYVTPADIPAALPRIVDAFDTPFGNASAVPTYFCAKLAADAGFPRMVAGDGGDELFGGNTRYAKQLLFEHYRALPGGLRSRLVEPLLERWPGAAAGGPLAKLASYVRQAAVPLPARLMSYNLLNRIDPASVLTADFIAALDLGHPARTLETLYAGGPAMSTLNRLLRLDWRLTLADSDLPKVSRMCELAGMEVTYPMLDEAIFEFAARLPAAAKVKGKTLRPLYRRAYADFLPQSTLTKRKHGFGLPFGIWLRESPPLHDLVAANLAYLEACGILKRGFHDDFLAGRFHQHAGYFGTLLWVLVCLALWLQQNRIAVD